MKKTKPSWEARPHTAFSYSFTPGEFRYFLFGKKICPSCGGKLQRQKQQPHRKQQKLHRMKIQMKKQM